ncbi:MAG: hypothetical protein COB67_08455 [SAR324 cluster bacterium]|uniref:DUF1444 family protein n=1 Tax=SAR324 cluster bacterium TaxID=2024889 RepID=A0A2A4T372_9DELT|nr:MAG: hypothetical protein COB67_08455 [SAR324 cluster bacterium]
MDKKQFTDYFLERFILEFSELTFSKVSELHISLSDLEGLKSDIFLENAYGDYLSEYKNIEAITQDRINQLKNQASRNASVNSSNIFPVLKPLSFLDNVRKQLGETNNSDGDLSMVFHKLNEDIFIFYVFNTQESMNFVLQEDLDKLNINASDIRKIAVENLEEHFSKIDVSIKRMEYPGKGNIFLLSTDKNYEASALLSAMLWNKKILPVKGDFVAFVPTRSMLLVVGSKDTQGIQDASTVATQGYEEIGYSISPYGYLKKDDQWIRFDS